MRLRALLLVTLLGCGSAAPGPGTATAQDVDLPGVDTSQFTPRERHEFSDYVKALPAPCKEVAVPLAQCVLEKRACEACTPAAAAVATAVREGYSRDQVDDMYKRRFDASSSSGIPLAGSPSRGPENAHVVLVEFADFECPFCQKVAPQLDATWEKRKDAVRFVYKYMPLSMHPRGEAVARAAIAAQMQGKFWEMHHLLFANPEHHEPPDLEKYATAIGLDVDRFRADMQSEAATKRIADDRKLADDLKVHGTPTIFIDGREYDFKADLGDWLDQEIAARK
ncbi:MAG TPA: thioredoxin domain-containing protein [Polyangiaceae bacterium]|jgi:protein-disulfide isomerase